MSAFVVDKPHIDLLVATAYEGPRDSHRAVMPGNTVFPLRRFGERDYLGAMLWQENVASVAHRYASRDHLPGPNDFTADDAAAYRYEAPGFRLSIVEALHAIACYEYQTCEHPGWPESQAFRFCDHLRDALIRCLPDYDKAPWEWTRSLVAERRATARCAQVAGRFLGNR